MRINNGPQTVPATDLGVGSNSQTFADLLALNPGLVDYIENLCTLLDIPAPPAAPTNLDQFLTQLVGTLSYRTNQLPNRGSFATASAQAGQSVPAGTVWGGPPEPVLLDGATYSEGGGNTLSGPGIWQFDEPSDNIIAQVPTVALVRMTFGLEGDVADAGRAVGFGATSFATDGVGNSIATGESSFWQFYDVGQGPTLALYNHGANPADVRTGDTTVTVTGWAVLA